MGEERQETTALARVEPRDFDGLTMVATPQVALKRLRDLQAFVAEVMKPSSKGKADGDYGIIPGTDKPALLKPGAEKLCEIYGLAHTPARFAARHLRPHTPIAGLFLTGSDICTAGVGGALMGGMLTATAITRRNMISAVLDGERPTTSSASTIEAPTAAR